MNNKWIRGVIPALLIHGSIGSVYAWSLFVNPIAEYIGASQQSVQFAFSLAIFFLGMSAAFCGGIVEKNIHRSSLISVICFCSGLILTGIAIYTKSLWLIYIGYGCLMGIGLGVGYLTPVKTLMLWFEDKKGLATGISVCAFGFASAIASPIITWLMTFLDLPFVFLSLCAIYFIPMMVAHFLIKKPSWFKEPQTKSSFKSSAMLKSKPFIKIWFLIFINIACGLALISVASPLLTEQGCNVDTIALAVSIMGICNGLGRLVFSAVSDKLKDRKYIYILIFVLSIFTIGISILIHSTLLTIIMLCAISSTYGAGFSNLPPLLSDRYGMTDISKIHGLSLSAWGVAGLCGNQLSATMKNIIGSYESVLFVLLGLYLIGLIITLMLRQEKSKKVR